MLTYECSGTLKKVDTLLTLKDRVSMAKGQDGLVVNNKNEKNQNKSTIFLDILFFDVYLSFPG